MSRTVASELLDVRQRLERGGLGDRRRFDVVWLWYDVIAVI
jgi:hypothetical protein